MDLGTRRQLRRERLRREHGTPAATIFKDETTAAWIALVMICVGVSAGSFGHMPIAHALERIYCTPVACASLPQALTGWAIAVAPLPVFLWRRDLAVYLGLLLVTFMSTLFVTSNQDIPVEINPIIDLWVLSLTYFVVGMLFVPLSLGISRLVRPSRRAVVVAAQHWLLLAVLVLWLA
ncbi:hypothetical protein ACIA8G_14270 [Lentzea sp. NPDC051213]|uniref:hypothetical protein n=1 Tax=Lentzea sp. NPDC051213 TaxID=3364126 RepID=UPI003794C7BB